MPKGKWQNIFFFFQMIKGKVKAGKVDCQAYAQICQEAGIRAYPTVKFYQYDGTKVCAGFLLLSFFSRPSLEIYFQCEYVLLFLN
jgi:hypothetical protein